RKVSGKEDVENGIWLRIIESLHDATCVDLAQRSSNFGDKFDIRLTLAQELLEALQGRLAVLIVWINNCPALLVEFGCLGDQRGYLHVRGRTQAKRIAVALLPGDLVGQRLGGQKEHFALLGIIRQGQ